MAPTSMAGRLGRGLTANYHLVTLLLCVMFLFGVVTGDILVYQQDQLMEEYRDYPATFGGDIPESGIKVRAVRANPVDGCVDIDHPPENVTTARFVVIIARYNCSFEQKVRNAQRAGYAAVIVHNVGSNELEHMSANHAEDIVIPSVFIGENNGMDIMESYLYPYTFALIITDDVPFNINNNLIIPFAIVVGLCFVIMVCFMIIRCIRERRRMLRHRLPTSVLKKIRVVKFAKGMQYDTCAICLDDYVDNERLRVLPCHHAYHVKCIDPWLTKNRRVCPICKRKVFACGERRPPRRRSSTDSMSSSDADESTPLVNPATAAASSPSVPTSQADTTTTASERQSRSAQQQQQRRPNDAHVVNLNSDDDELLDDNNVHSVLNTATRQLLAAPQRRFNPAWERFCRKVRFPRRNRGHEELPSGDDDEPAATGAGNTIPVSDGGNRIAINGGATAAAAAASNNILNSNLSGSFHGEDTTDDEMVGTSYRDEAKRRQIRSAPNLPSTSGIMGGGGGESASSGAGRVGVAALPNVNFNPNQPTREPGRRSQHRSGGGSRGNYPV